MAENGNGKLFGWRKMIAAFGSITIINFSTLVYWWAAHVALTGDQWVSLMYANAYIIMALMGGNAVSHVAQAINRK
jgi:hypothetical protein